MAMFHLLKIRLSVDIVTFGLEYIFVHCVVHLGALNGHAYTNTLGANFGLPCTPDNSPSMPNSLNLKFHGHLSDNI